MKTVGWCGGVAPHAGGGWASVCGSRRPRSRGRWRLWGVVALCISSRHLGARGRHGRPAPSCASLVFAASALVDYAWLCEHMLGWQPAAPGPDAQDQMATADRPRHRRRAAAMGVELAVRSKMAPHGTHAEVITIALRESRSAVSRRDDLATSDTTCPVTRQCGARGRRTAISAVATRVTQVARYRQTAVTSVLCTAVVH